MEDLNSSIPHVGRRGMVCFFECEKGRLVFLTAEFFYKMGEHIIAKL